MTARRCSFVSIAVAVTLGACQYHARSPVEYRNDTRVLLEKRTPELQACYAEILQSDPNATGRVVARFTVSARTGVVATAEILPESTAPVPVQECIRLALYGLTLEPPDAREGDATFVWTFSRS